LWPHPAAIIHFAMTIRVLTADDHPLIRVGIAALIRNELDMAVVAEAANGTEAVQLYERERPDVTVMDLRMPLLDGIGATNAILARHPQARIVALTSRGGDADIARAIGAGVRGYLLKDARGRDVIDAIRRVAAGCRVIPPGVAQRLAEFKPQGALTTREQDVLRLVAKGFRNREIASLIGRSTETVKMHLKHVMAKLDVEHRTEAVTLALERGIIHLGD
jgi:DNA-binding NarL/FixJ family response regulator